MNDVRTCETCGSAVTVHGNLDKYYLPIHGDLLEKLMDRYTTDGFIRDRLRRAEQIIENLREKLDECRSKNRANLEGS